MNRQQGPHCIEWTDWTWNPVGGCKHGCRWEMPDGTIAACYAERVAQGVAQAHYPDGFAAHTWRPGLLDEPLAVRTPAKIFLDSMADLFGSWVPQTHIDLVLVTVARAHWHTFQVLTKNAPRLLQFKDDLPPNLWAGVSIPPTFFRGERLELRQQVKMFARALDVLGQLPVPVRWVSLEPLSFDVADLLRDAPVQWAVIGAATRGAKAYQPKREWVKRVLDVLDGRRIPVFFKGNLEWEPRRSAFPDPAQVAAPVEQLSLL